MTGTPLRYEELVKPTAEMAAVLDRWENDPELVPAIRPNRTQQELEEIRPVTIESLKERLERTRLFLIYRGEQLIGMMSYQVDTDQLLKKVPGSAWIGITIGEREHRGKGVGYQALEYLEKHIAAQGLRRIELGVFEFNHPAIALYRKLGYHEIGRIEKFTYWQGRRWQDIHMEKFLGE